MTTNYGYQGWQVEPPGSVEICLWNTTCSGNGREGSFSLPSVCNSRKEDVRLRGCSTLLLPLATSFFLSCSPSPLQPSADGWDRLSDFESSSVMTRVESQWDLWQGFTSNLLASHENIPVISGSVLKSLLRKCQIPIQDSHISFPGSNSEDEFLQVWRSCWLFWCWLAEMSTRNLHPFQFWGQFCT